MTAPAVAVRPRGRPVTDSITMVRRQLVHLVRYPSLTIMLLAIPVIFLLLFVFVFGGQLASGAAGGRAAYLAYLTPGILAMTIGTAVNGTAVSVASDMTEGIVARFRTMAIARVSVLTGHVVGSVIQAGAGVAIVLGLAVALGYRPAAGLPGWLAAIGVLGAFTVALVWLAVALGLVARSVETASNTPLVLTLLPMLGSGFVSPSSMPAGLRQFAEYQPFTPVIDAVRGLLAGTPVGTTPLVALAWSVGIGGASYLWARRLYDRHAAR